MVSDIYPIVFNFFSPSHFLSIFHVVLIFSKYVYTGTDFCSNQSLYLFQLVIVSIFLNRCCYYYYYFCYYCLLLLIIIFIIIINPIIVVSIIKSLNP